MDFTRLISLLFKKNIFIESSIEHPEEMIGIYRIEHVMLFNEDDEELYDDKGIAEYELVIALANA